MFVFLFFALFFGVMFWYFGGSQVKDEIPYYVKDVIHETAKVNIHGQIINAEVVKTASAMEHGLSGRESLPIGHGMLFSFGKEGIYPFTMRGMNFPIDIIWIDNNKVVRIQANAPAPKAGEEPAVYTPAEMSDYVLETRSGFSKSVGLEVGDEIIIDLAGTK